ncbi:hypothetical protein [Orientia tsutsugamushi]|uniref:hypothetical protein n=1 Tax=Orientia tsutsugamushi TaxID=784 RepID=UPI00209330B7|nr:hypothetical protein [Orientia tsutsugamushi]
MFNGIGRVFASNSEYFTPVGHLALTIGGIWLLLGLFLEEISASLLWIHLTLLFYRPIYQG